MWVAVGGVYAVLTREVAVAALSEAFTVAEAAFVEGTILVAEFT